MNLDTATKVLQIVLGEAKTTNNCAVVSSYADFGLAAGTFVWGNQNVLTNGTTPVIVVTAPESGFQRQVKEVRLFNNDTVTHTVTLQLYDGTSTWIIAPGLVSVPANGSFVYTPESGVFNTVDIDILLAGALGATVNNGTVEINNSITMAGTAAGTLTIAPGSGTSMVVLDMPAAGGTVSLVASPQFKGQEWWMSIHQGATASSINLNTGFVFGTTVASYTPSAATLVDDILCVSQDGTHAHVEIINKGFSV
jgi:hypothetical protein